MLRRLHQEQPESFAFTPDNKAWAEAQITKFPDGRQASAIIPLLWRAQEQEGWLTRPAIEHVADMLDMDYIRALEVATFYFMFHLQPVGSVAHIQVCGTTSCMICGAEDLVGVCREKIAANPHELSEDGKFSWEEVECLGACANAPMAQIGKDYYEDLTADRLGDIIDALAGGRVPGPGPQNGRYASEPETGLTSLKDFESGRTKFNASVGLAMQLGDTVKRIDGSEGPLLTPWREKGANHDPSAPEIAAPTAPPAAQTPPARPDSPKAGQAPAEESSGETTPKPAPEKMGDKEEAGPGPGKRPAVLDAPREGGADDLKMIKGIGPKLENLLNSMGFFHYDQIAGWSADEIAWVDENLTGFKGRVTRDNWVKQAGRLAAGDETEFSKRAKRDDIY